MPALSHLWQHQDKLTAANEELCAANEERAQLLNMVSSSTAALAVTASRCDELKQQVLQLTATASRCDEVTEQLRDSKMQVLLLQQNIRGLAAAAGAVAEMKRALLDMQEAVPEAVEQVRRESEKNVYAVVAAVTQSMSCKDKAANTELFNRAMQCKQEVMQARCERDEAMNRCCAPCTSPPALLRAGQRCCQVPCGDGGEAARVRAPAAAAGKHKGCVQSEAVLVARSSYNRVPRRRQRRIRHPARFRGSSRLCCYGKRVQAACKLWASCHGKQVSVGGRKSVFEFDKVAGCCSALPLARRNVSLAGARCEGQRRGCVQLPAAADGQRAGRAQRVHFCIRADGQVRFSEQHAVHDA